MSVYRSFMRSIENELNVLMLSTYQHEDKRECRHGRWAVSLLWMVEHGTFLEMWF